MNASSEPKPPRRRLPRVSIRGMFYLTACLCVAFTVGASGSGLGDADWSAVLLTLATLGVATELLGQAAVARREPGYAMACFVRYAAVGALTGCLGLRVAERCGWPIHAERNDLILLLYWEYPFPDAIWYTVLIAGASALCGRFKQQTGSIATWRSIGVCALAVCIAVYVAVLVSDFSFVPYLVHIATAGIEAAESLAWQRPGAFPAHGREGYFTYWAVTSAAGLLAGAVCLVGWFARSRKPFMRWVLGVGFMSVCTALAAFSWWYFWMELPRISPDLANAGWAFTIGDAIGGVALLLIVALWMACLLVREGQETIGMMRPTRGLFGVLPTWIGAVGLILGGGASVTLFAVEAIRDYSGFFASTMWGALPHVVRMLLLSPQLLMLVALTAAGARLAWSAWRSKEDEISRLPAGQTALTFAMLLLLGLVAVPTLTAYSFGSWFGPWWR